MSFILALSTWALIICSEFLLLFLSLMLAVGWSNLIVQHTSLLGSLRGFHRNTLLVLCLYSPVIISICAETFINFNQNGLWTPIYSLWAFDLGPLWWVIGVVGFLILGLQASNFQRPNIVSALFLIAGFCYILSILSSLISLSHSSIPTVEVGWGWLFFLNIYMALGFLIATIYSTKFQSWRAIFT